MRTWKVASIFGFLAITITLGYCWKFVEHRGPTEKLFVGENPVAEAEAYAHTKIPPVGEPFFFFTEIDGDDVWAQDLCALARAFDPLEKEGWYYAGLTRLPHTGIDADGAIFTAPALTCLHNGSLHNGSFAITPDGIEGARLDRALRPLFGRTSIATEVVPPKALTELAAFDRLMVALGKTPPRWFGWNDFHFFSQTKGIGWGFGRPAMHWLLLSSLGILFLVSFPILLIVCQLNFRDWRASFLAVGLHMVCLVWLRGFLGASQLIGLSFPIDETIFLILGYTVILFINTPSFFNRVFDDPKSLRTIRAIAILTALAAFANLLPLPLPFGGTLGFSVRPLIELGVFGIVGILVGYLFTRIFLSLVSSLTKRDTPVQGACYRWFDAMIDGIANAAWRIIHRCGLRKRPQYIYGATFLLFLVAIYPLSRGSIKLETYPPDYLKGTPLGEDLEELNEKGNQGLHPLIAYLETSQTFESPGTLARLNALIAEIEAIPHVRFFAGVAQGVFQASSIYLENLPTTKGEAETMWDYATNYLAQVNLFSRLVHIKEQKRSDGTVETFPDGFPLIIGTGAPTDAAIEEVVKSIENILARHPEFSLFIYGLNRQFSLIRPAITQGFLSTILSANMIVAVGIGFLLWRWQKGEEKKIAVWSAAIAMIIPFLIAISIFLISVRIMGKSIDVVTVCIMSMAIVACNDIIVHYIKRFHENVMANPETAFEKTFWEDGRMAVKDVFINFMHFVPLTLPFVVFIPPIRELGIAITTTLLVTLAAFLVLMPPALERAVIKPKIKKARGEKPEMAPHPWQKAAAL